MVDINYILKLLNFQENELVINNIIENDNIYTICAIAKFKRMDVSCPQCGSSFNNIHGYNTRIIKHINIGIKSTILKVKVPRFICMEKECGATFNLNLNFVQKNNKISNELRNIIRKETHKPKTFSMIGKEGNISSTSVNNIFKENLMNHRAKLTKIICIDEFKADTNFGKYAFIIGDPISGTILNILPDRKINYIKCFLSC